MTTPTEPTGQPQDRVTDDWVAGCLDDFRACLAGSHGPAWRSRAERELRTTSPALASDRQRAASWLRARQEVTGPTAA